MLSKVIISIYIIFMAAELPFYNHYNLCTSRRMNIYTTSILNVLNFENSVSW